MNILVLGSGGREHAMAWRFSKSPLANNIFVAPGNGGISSEKIQSIPDLNPSHHEQLLSFIQKNKIEYVFVGPENYLAEGIIDFLDSKNILCLGPSRKAAQLESSKVFSKKLMLSAGISTAEAQFFNDLALAEDFLKQDPWAGQYVLKMDGLAAGKGVRVCSTRSEALESLEFFKQGGAGFVNGQTLLIEKKVVGKEVSAFALCDGNQFVTIGFASDFKRLNDNDKGPNTGGMGSITPVFWLSEEHKKQIEENVFAKTLKAMNERGTPFKGILFAGLMIDRSEINVLEYNVRMGDPETQSLTVSLDVDWLPVFMEAAKGKLVQNPFKNLEPKATLHVVLAAPGYPGTEGILVKQNIPIKINAHTQTATSHGSTHCFFAGVKNTPQGLISSGGRVLGISSTASTPEACREMTYQYIKNIQFEGAQYRTDISWK